MTLEVLATRLSTVGTLSQEDRRALLELPFTSERHGLGTDLRVAAEGQAVLLTAGFVIRHKTVADGGRQIVAVHVPGDVIHAHTSLVEPGSRIDSLTRVEIARIQAAPLLKLAFTHPEIGRAMWREALIASAISREWIASLGRRSARGRVAHLICETAVRCERAGMGTHEGFELPMTQEQLGDALGLTAVHINRTLRALQEDGLIQRSKRSIAVADWPGLVREAGFDPSYLLMAG